MLSYFLADDTMSVFEPPVRNSGIVGGALGWCLTPECPPALALGNTRRRQESMWVGISVELLGRYNLGVRCFVISDSSAFNSDLHSCMHELV